MQRSRDARKKSGWMPGIRSAAEAPRASERCALPLPAPSQTDRPRAGRAAIRSGPSSLRWVVPGLKQRSQSSIYLLAAKQPASCFKDTTRVGQLTLLCASPGQRNACRMLFLPKRLEACLSFQEPLLRCTRSPHTASFKQGAKMGLVRQFPELAGGGATRARASRGENKIPAQRQSQKQGFAETSTPKRTSPG